VCPGAPPRRPPTAVEFLLSHHLPERFDRTVSLPGSGGSVRLCARCTGQGAGAVAVLLVVALGGIARGPLFSPEVQVWFAIAPLAAAVDWVRQAVLGAESTTPRRMITGALLGAALLDTAILALSERWFELAIAVGVFLLYALAIMAILVSSGAWRTVLSEHFPGISLPPG
jgi:uncharacterized membrane protein